MNWEVKLPFYLFLVYLLYALFSWVEIGEFVPPIFLMPVIIFVVGLFYVFKNMKSIYGVVYLSFSLVFTLNLNPLLSSLLKNFFGLLAMFILVLYAILLIKNYLKSKSGPSFLISPTVIFAIPVLLYENNFFSFFFFLALFISSFFSYKKRLFNSIGQQRFLLLAGFTSSLYIINFLPLVCNFFLS